MFIFWVAYRSAKPPNRVAFILGCLKVNNFHFRGYLFSCMCPALVVYPQYENYRLLSLNPLSNLKFIRNDCLRTIMIQWPPPSIPLPPGWIVGNALCLTGKMIFSTYTNTYMLNICVHEHMQMCFIFIHIHIGTQCIFCMQKHASGWDCQHRWVLLQLLHDDGLVFPQLSSAGHWC